MSAPLSCCLPTCTPEYVSIPGIDGTAGVDAFTLVGAPFVVPAPSNVPGFGDVIIAVDDATWVAEGQWLFIEGAGTFLVLDVPSDQSLHLQYCDYFANINAGVIIPIGNKVSPSGAPPLYSGLMFGSGDPNGVQTAIRPAMFYDAVGNVWIKTDATLTNTGWSKIISV